jgi:hypothetical protein
MPAEGSRDGIRGLRETEVQHLHGAVVAHFDVRGLQVAVDDAGLVGGLERLCDLLCDRQGSRDALPL